MEENQKLTKFIFHTNYAIEYLKKQLKTVVQVVADAPEIKSTKIELNPANENRKLTLEEKYQKILLLQVVGNLIF